MRRDGNGRERVQVPRVAENDNGGPEARIDAAAMCLARLLGRQIVREHFQQCEAANDNAPPEKEAHDR